MFNPLLKKWVGKGDLDYEVYLKTGTLLHLQTPSEELVHHDELLFQVTHQAQELWLKLITQEAVEVVAELDGDVLWPATGRMERILRAMRCLVAEMNILETMTPDTYQIIRRSLGNGSGQESPGYNAMRLAADAMEAALDRALARRNLRLLDVYKVGAYGAEDLKRICEQFVDLDELFQTWLYTHYQMVRRIIGVDRSIKALDGLPTQVLAGRMTLPLFRKLWEVRVEMTSAWRRDGGYTPGTHRASDSHPTVPATAPNAQVPSPPAPSAQAPSPPALAAQAPSPPAPTIAHFERTLAAAPPAAPSPVAVSAQALASTAAQGDTSAAASAAPAAPPEDPWSRPEPPRRGQAPQPELPPAPPSTMAEPDDPWSRPEPPTSRRAAQMLEDATSPGSQAQEPVGTGPRRAPPSKDRGQY
ncbi:tryptophan 2,3-dioxygenase family protein [Hyalangium sp.]|uniref:tryptophan 2,3-dioxygenase family protein n=1 Tax=Hyalangium sp. TaxID=2028555 RepID=UPI002D235FA3|nr:tryptophan 2,3-dioxygenase family protein [Hyalangium sp.]HYH95917.1 tryptophan 2,3-dioxygenase family protein [Hyalangium sp.]